MKEREKEKGKTEGSLLASLPIATWNLLLLGDHTPNIPCGEGHRSSGGRSWFDKLTRFSKPSNLKAHRLGENVRRTNLWPSRFGKNLNPLFQHFCAKPSTVHFVRQFPLNFQTHVYFPGNVIHMFLIHLHLNHHNAVLLSYLMSKKPMRPFTSPLKAFSFEPASHGFPVQNVN